MSESAMGSWVDGIVGRFEDALRASVSARTREVTLELGDVAKLVEVCQSLRDEFGFEMLIDLAGLDYL
ncbi:MAG: NADH-quinone oxidoreductase subunit C, partial [Gammaproteobacteria bacterium]|nr:NADH-quinone oxidoreductase subunit C [Gammaproteobacteria bacterium]